MDARGHAALFKVVWCCCCDTAAFHRLSPPFILVLLQRAWPAHSGRCGEYRRPHRVGAQRGGAHAWRRAAYSHTVFLVAGRRGCQVSPQWLSPWLACGRGRFAAGDAPHWPSKDLGGADVSSDVWDPLGQDHLRDALTLPPTAATFPDKIWLWARQPDLPGRCRCWSSTKHRHPLRQRCALASICPEQHCRSRLPSAGGQRPQTECGEPLTVQNEQ